jgi:hypothetical protein
MTRSHVTLVCIVAVLAMALSGCGGNATSPSAVGVTLNGTATDMPTSAGGGVAALSGASAKASSAAITVTVLEDPSLTTAISGNGSFKLEGLPAGTFTLVFSSNGATLGTVTVTSVPSEAVINLVVRISRSDVLVVKLEVNGSDETEEQAAKTCLIAGGTVGAGIELEGSVSSPTSTAGPSSFAMAVNGLRASGSVDVDYASALFDCAGVKGTCDATLIKTGARVHVRGSLTSCSTTAAVVKATQIKFQH